MFDWLRHLFPYTDFHELNADWLLQAVKKASDKAEEAASEVDTWDDRIAAAEANAAQAVQTANAASTAVQTVAAVANEARTTANTANTTADGAQLLSQAAMTRANEAKSTAETATNTAGEAQASAHLASQAAKAAQAQVANKAEVYHFMVTRPYLAHQGPTVLDQSEWNILFQDLLYNLDDEKKIPILSVRDETETQGVYTEPRQVFPTIEVKNQERIWLSWFDLPDGDDKIRCSRLGLTAATAYEAEKAVYYEFTISAT